MTETAQQLIERNRKSGLFLKELDIHREPTGNVYYVPKGWCDDFTLAAGCAGGPDCPHEPEIYCYAPTKGGANSPVETFFVSVYLLAELPEIEESTARRIHPRLFEYLKMLNDNGADPRKP